MHDCCGSACRGNASGRQGVAARGMPLAEIGRRMGSNRNAIYKLTHDARKRLKQGLEAAGYDARDLQIA